MSEAMNEYEILLQIFRFIRDYSTSTYSLADVSRRCLKDLKASGYTTAKLTSLDRDTKLITISDYHFKILRRKGWSIYDVTMN